MLSYYRNEWALNFTTHSKQSSKQRHLKGVTGYFRKLRKVEYRLDSRVRSDLLQSSLKFYYIYCT